jgi:hypothetical protein
MRKTISALVMLLFITACDNIDENNRYKESGYIEAQKRVLLEDFTGQNCPNCPTAAVIANELQNISNGNLIVVSIHAGGLSYRTFRTTEGNEYLNAFYSDGDETGYPAGMIDRTMINGNRVSTEYNKWSTYITSRYQVEAKIGLQVSCIEDGVSNNVTINTNIEGISVTDDPLRLQLWLIESGITSWQKVAMDDGSTVTNSSYVHNHVFREAINGTWGEEIELAKGENLKKQNDFVFDTSKYNAQNCQIVAFVYNKSTYEVYQCAECNLLNK